MVGDIGPVKKSLRRVLPDVSSQIQFYPTVDPRGGVERGSVGQYQANGRGAQRHERDEDGKVMFAAHSPQAGLHSLC